MNWLTYQMECGHEETLGTHVGFPSSDEALKAGLDWGLAENQ